MQQKDKEKTQRTVRGDKLQSANAIILFGAGSSQLEKYYKFEEFLFKETSLCYFWSERDIWPPEKFFQLTYSGLLVYDFAAVNLQVGKHIVSQITGQKQTIIKVQYGGFMVVLIEHQTQPALPAGLVLRSKLFPAAPGTGLHSLFFIFLYLEEI